MSKSEELHEQWKNHGGDLEQYRETYHRDVTDDNGRTAWHPSFVYRYHKSPNPGRSSDPAASSDIGERHRPPVDTHTCDNCNTINSTGTSSYSKLLWKHRGTDTWMHLKSDTSLIVGEPIGFKAWVTIKGQHATVGEYYVSTDPHEVFEWARDWMEEHETVDELYED